MFIVMIFSYAIVAFIDLKATYHNQDKRKLIVYLTLMVISCAIGITSGYVRVMPSPVRPIQQLVFSIMGK